MKKRFLVISAVAVLGVSSLTFNSFATNVNNQTTQESQNKERPERPKNVVFGKITAISENSVTITIAEMKKPENGQNDFGKNAGGQDGAGKFERKNDENKDGGNNNQNGNDKKEPPEKKQLTEEQIAEMKKNIENMFTLTSETKTIDISSADFNDFGRRQKNGNDANASANTETKKTYKDYQVGDYISIELESETSNKAKTVRDAFMMRDGMLRGDRGEGFNGSNKTNNSNNTTN